MEKQKIEYATPSSGSIFHGLQVRKNPDEAFENAMKRGMKNPSDWMYMYSKGGRDYFKHCETRVYKSYPQNDKIRNRGRER